MAKFIWSIDDAGTGSQEMIDSVGRTCDLMAEVGVTATWFTVPKGGGRPITDEWRAAMLAAQDRGHDLQLHGLTHSDCQEWGPPSWPATQILPTLRPNFDEKFDDYRDRYTPEGIRSRLTEAFELFCDRLGTVPVAFRAPCGARCKELYRGLTDLGIRYDSSIYISATGYAHLDNFDGQVVQRWEEEIPVTPFRYYHDTVQAPILNEYTWKQSGSRSAEFVALAKADLVKAAAETDIVVLLAHTHGLAHDYDHTRRVLTAVRETVDAEGLGSFATFAEVIASGELDAAVAGSLDDLEM